MTPQIKAVWPSVQPPSKVGQRRWNVAYEFCQVLARVTVRAADEAEARTKAAHQLRKRGQSRCRKSAQDDKWSFCLTAGTLCPTNQERQ
jgi:predicted amidophosphoribosyltransferase